MDGGLIRSRCNMTRARSPTFNITKHLQAQPLHISLLFSHEVAIDSHYRPTTWRHIWTA